MPSGGMEGPREQRNAGIYSQANEVEERRARPRGWQQPVAVSRPRREAVRGRSR